MAGDRQTDWCCGCSDLDAVPVRRGEERIERKKKEALNLAVGLRCRPAELELKSQVYF